MHKTTFKNKIKNILSSKEKHLLLVLFLALVTLTSCQIMEMDSQILIAPVYVELTADGSRLCIHAHNTESFMSGFAIFTDAASNTDPEPDRTNIVHDLDEKVTSNDYTLEQTDMTTGPQIFDIDVSGLDTSAIRVRAYTQVHDVYSKASNLATVNPDRTACTDQTVPD